MAIDGVSNNPFPTLKVTVSDLPRIKPLQPLPVGSGKQPTMSQDQLSLSRPQQAPQAIVLPQQPQQQNQDADWFGKFVNYVVNPVHTGFLMGILQGGLPKVGQDLAQIGQGLWNGITSLFGGGQPSQPLPQPAVQAAPQAAPAPTNYAGLARNTDKYAQAFDKADTNHDGQLTGDELTNNGVLYADPFNVGAMSKADFVQQAAMNEGLARQQAIDLSNDTDAASKAINELYKRILGRDATPQEIAKGTDELRSGMTLDEIAEQLKSSPEAQVRAAFQDVWGQDFFGNTREFYLGKLNEAGGDIDRLKRYMAEEKKFYANPTHYVAPDGITTSPKL